MAIIQKTESTDIFLDNWMSIFISIPHSPAFTTVQNFPDSVISCVSFAQELSARDRHHRLDTISFSAISRFSFLLTQPHKGGEIVRIAIFCNQKRRVLYKILPRTCQVTRSLASDTSVVCRKRNLLETAYCVKSGKFSRYTLGKNTWT